jgi:hypothetical protein
MGCDLFSFYGVRADGSVVSWDSRECANEAAAAEHASLMRAERPDLVGVEVWSVDRLRFTVPAYDDNQALQPRGSDPLQ